MQGCAPVAPVAPASSASAAEGLMIALGKTFFVVLLGYVCAVTKFVVPETAKGLGQYAGRIALPALLFRAIASLDLGNVNWTWLAVTGLAKGVVFGIALTIVLIFSRGDRLGVAGLFAIFCTQSNDVALGYPIIQAMMPPKFLDYLWLNAPLQLCVLNPIGFVLLEFWLSGKDQEKEGKSKSVGQIVLGVIRGVITNPIVASVFLGLIYTLIFKGKIPRTIDQALTLTGAGFAPAALFNMGMSLVGKAGVLKGRGLTWPVILVLLKCVALPIVCRGLASVMVPIPSLPPAPRTINGGPPLLAPTPSTKIQLLHTGEPLPPQPDMSMPEWEALREKQQDAEDFSMFAFIYGAIPTAAGVFLYATQYKLKQDVVSGATVLGLALSAPIIFLAIILLENAGQDEKMGANIRITSRICASITILCTTILVMLGIFIKKRRRFPDLLVTLLAAAQLAFGISHLLCDVLHETSATGDYVYSAAVRYTIYNLANFFRFQAIINFALLASSLLALVYIPRYTKKAAWSFYVISWVCPGFFTALLHVFQRERFPPYACWVVYGFPQRIMVMATHVVTFCLYMITLAVTRHAKLPPRLADAMEEIDVSKLARGKSFIDVHRERTQSQIIKEGEQLDNKALLSDDDVLSDTDEPDKVSADPPTPKPTSDRWRIWMLLTIESVNAAFSMALLVQQFYGYEGHGSQWPSPKGTMLLQLLFAVVLQDGQGLYNFLAFGMREDAVELYQKVFFWCDSCYRKFFRMMGGGGGSEGEEDITKKFPGQAAVSKLKATSSDVYQVCEILIHNEGNVTRQHEASVFGENQTFPDSVDPDELLVQIYQNHPDWKTQGLGMSIGQVLVSKGVLSAVGSTAQEFQSQSGIIYSVNEDKLMLLVTELRGESSEFNTSTAKTSRHVGDDYTSSSSSNNNDSEAPAGATTAEIADPDVVPEPEEAPVLEPSGKEADHSLRDNETL